MNIWITWQGNLTKRNIVLRAQFFHCFDIWIVGEKVLFQFLRKPTLTLRLTSDCVTCCIALELWSGVCSVASKSAIGLLQSLHVEGATVLANLEPWFVVLLQKSLSLVAGLSDVKYS